MTNTHGGKYTLQFNGKLWDAENLTREQSIELVGKFDLNAKSERPIAILCNGVKVADVKRCIIWINKTGEQCEF